MPSGLPDYLKPDFSGADINRLRNDISKWCRWMREESRIEWSEFLELGLNQMSSGTLSNDNQLWPLQYLCTLAAIHEEASNRALDLDSPIPVSKGKQVVSGKLL